MNTIKAIKNQTNLSELLFYLEEMYVMDMLTDKETDIYERYKFGHQMNSSERSYVYSCMQEYYNEAF